jgi:hypothetical protein
MSWVHCEGQENREFYVRASDIAEVEVGTDERVAFRRRGHPHQYIAKGDDVNKLLDLITRNDTEPPPAIVSPRPAPPPEPPAPKQPAPTVRILEVLEGGAQWRPQLRACLIEGGMSPGTAQAALAVITRNRLIDDKGGLLSLNNVGREQLAIGRKIGKLSIR